MVCLLRPCKILDLHVCLRHRNFSVSCHNSCQDPVPARQICMNLVRPFPVLVVLYVHYCLVRPVILPLRIVPVYAASLVARLPYGKTDSADSRWRGNVMRRQLERPAFGVILAYRHLQARLAHLEAARVHAQAAPVRQDHVRVGYVLPGLLMVTDVYIRLPRARRILLPRIPPQVILAVLLPPYRCFYTFQLFRNTFHYNSFISIHFIFC